MYSASQQARLAMNLVTRQRAIPAAYAQIHIHHEQICSVDDSGIDLLAGSGDNASVAKGFESNIVIRAGEFGEGSIKSVTELHICAQQSNRNFQKLRASEHRCRVMPFLFSAQSFQSEAVTRA